MRREKHGHEQCEGKSTDNAKGKAFRKETSTSVGFGRSLRDFERSISKRIISLCCLGKDDFKKRIIFKNYYSPESCPNVMGRHRCVSSLERQVMGKKGNSNKRLLRVTKINCCDHVWHDG